MLKIVYFYSYITGWFRAALKKFSNFVLINLVQNSLL